MRVVIAAVVGAGAALLAGTAAAGPVPVPPVPTVPTVTVPSTPVAVPVPLPVIPQLPKPVLAEPVRSTASSAPAVQQAAGHVLGTASSTPSTGVGGATASTGSSSSSSVGGRDNSRVDHFHSTRRWIGTSGTKRRRSTTFVFVLQRAGRVVFTVNQVSPACVGIGRFSVSGHPGLNRVHFAGVVHGHQLTPGTYRISIRTASGRIVRRVTLVVVGGSAPSADELAALRASNVCHGDTPPAATSTGSFSSSSGSSPTSSGGQPGAPLGAQTLPKPKPAAAGLVPADAPNLHSGVLASSVEKTARAVEPLLVALLALSIVLLGAASLPRAAVPGPRVHEVLARHRIELAGLGAAALVAVALAFLLT
jgi:hypothetical protein